MLRHRLLRKWLEPKVFRCEGKVVSLPPRATVRTHPDGIAWAVGSSKAFRRWATYMPSLPPPCFYVDDDGTSRLRGQKTNGREQAETGCSALS